MKCSSIILLASLATLLHGCAWVFMEPVKDNIDLRVSEPHCTTNLGFVYWDLAIIGADATAILLVSRLPEDTTGFDKRALIAGAAAEGVLHLISAINGGTWANECEEAIAKRATYVRAASGAVTRGFYCAQSVCARQKSECNRFRKGFQDPSECVLKETAFCLRVGNAVACRPTLDACELQRASTSRLTSQCYQDF